MSSATGAVEVAIDLPPCWVEVTTDRGVLDDRLLRAEVDRIVTDAPELQAFTDEVAEEVRATAAVATAVDAVIAAVGTAARGGEFVTAALFAHVLEWPRDAASGAPFDGLDGLEAAVRADLGLLVDEDVAPAAAPVRRVALPSGPAIRVRTLEEEGDGRHDIVVEHVRFFVVPPVPDTVLLLDFTTPSVAFADELAESFDQVARTLRAARA